MIAKGKSIAHGANAIDYVLDKNKAEIIDKRFIIGENGKEMLNEFKIFQNLNTRTTNNNISFVLSPEPNDGRKLSNEDFKAISEDFLKKMKLDKHQAIIAKHSDKDHTHLHLIVNRIDSNGKAYKDSWISKESQTKADEVAQERGLTRASVVKEFNLEMTRTAKAEILTKHKAVAQHKPKDFNEYKDLMKESGIEVIPTINSKEKLQGFKVKYQNQVFKASEITEKSKVKIKGKFKDIKPLTLSQMGVKATFSEINPRIEIPIENKRNQGRRGGIRY